LVLFGVLCNESSGEQFGSKNILDDVTA
jgi:hypothetical protein